MPCEGCNVQFTVFRRKRICTDCRRYYCSHCLTNRNASTLCERCAIFAKRPLLKIDLLQLKPKDLIFYLQSKHISTKGCVEKEELVGLILTHVNQNETPNLGSSNGSKYSEPGEAERPFENIKQTCQNFFNNLTDKLTTDFNFDTKASTASTATTGSTTPAPSGPSSHISEQPRISTREIPTYSSYQNQPPSVQPQPSQQPPPPQQRATKSNNSTPTSPVSSPVVSLSSISSQSTAPRSPQPHATDDQRGSRSEQSSDRGTARSPPAHLSARNRLLETVLNDETNGSECECSDDELITTFKDRSNREGAGTSSSPTTSSPVDNQVAGPSASGPKSSPSLHIGSYEDSSESSFEELGAIGGISDDNKTDCNTQNETWQFINKPDSEGGPSDAKKQPPTAADDEGSAGGTTSACNSTDLALVSSESSSGPSRTATIFPTRPKRVTRRRSDGYLNRRRYAGDQVYHLIAKEQSVEEEGDEDDEDDEMTGRPQIWIRKSKCCEKCGKNKMSIKHHVMKLRRHLENAHMSEADIKRELEEFLVYLDSRMRSVECSDVGSATSPFLDENDGIHVYAHTEEEEEGIIDPKAAANRFLNLNDFETLEDLENLTVKQLKQILTLNRVDYKGCCEKQELLERVSRLWKNLKSCPAIDKLPTDELCKICMDAPIECVILECGHMATCTNCGKVLSECPICRQYIVRVVRFFRA